MRKLICTVAILASPFVHPTTASAVALVHPDGSPVGGQFQRWADQAKVPTFAGRLLFVSPEALCGAPVASCAVGPPWYGSQYEIAATSQSGLISELAHVFDWRYLTDTSRGWFAAIWHTSASWQDSADGLGRSFEDGLEGAFQVAYTACAAGGTSPGPMSWSLGAPVIAFGPATCALIDALGRGAGADVVRVAKTPSRSAVMARACWLDRRSVAAAKRHRHHARRWSEQRISRRGWAARS